MTPAPAAIQTTQPLRTRTIIMADSSTTVPTKIELIKSGTWPASSVKGPLTIMPSDLMEMKQNFDAGIGVPGGLGKLPIDYSHEEWGKAAGWITALDIETDDTGVATLYATVEWSKSGEQALADGEYKCVSPSFWPACIGEWYDPEDSEVTARNVLVGAGLTNIPFFKDLTAIMAARTSGSDSKTNNVIFIQADKEQTMSLDEIRVLDADKLSDEQKAFVIAHKEELSAEEQTKFATVLTASTEEADAAAAAAAAAQVEADRKNKEGNVMTDEQKEAAQIQADIKSGKKVLMDANEVETLKGQVSAHATQLADFRRKDIQASVVAHVNRGAIKADQVDKWVERIEADATMEEMLKDLPDNKLLASEIGTAGAADVSDAGTQFDQLVGEAMKADTTLTYEKALLKVAASNPQLAKDRQSTLNSK